MEEEHLLAEEKSDMNQISMPAQNEEAEQINIEAVGGEQYLKTDDSSVFVDPFPLSVPSKFEVDIKKIESVTVDDQDSDIKSLGLTVFNQSTLERGILDQVEKESKKREAEEELASVSTKLKIAEEQLRRDESKKSTKRSILQSALQEPLKKKPKSSILLSQQDVTHKKVEELRLKHAQLQARLSGSNEKDCETNEESERDRKIRMGEMTPFGTTLNAPSSSTLSSFEKYLKSQEELHKKMVSTAASKRKQSLSKSYELPQESSATQKKSSNKVISKRTGQAPKHPKYKSKPDTHLSERVKSKHRSSHKKHQETSEESCSEYLPSSSDDDADYHPGIPVSSEDSSSKCQSNDKCPSSEISKKKSQSDKWSGGSLRKRKRNAQYLPNGDPDDWHSDDSDWICTDDEDFVSDSETGCRRTSHSKKEKDDGNSEDFFRRTKQWERQNEGMREQMEVNVHEFENGYKIPSFIWDKLYLYQQVGVRWMWELNQQKCGGILGDEMGLGKTVQVISFLAGLSVSRLKCHITGYRGLGPTLIVCPTTVMHQWVREFHTWFPPLRVAVLHESGCYVGKRSQLIRDMLHEKGILITSYTAVVRLKDHLLHQRWHYVILDEGHKIRNPDAQITLAVKQLRTPHRLILSGSPLQNHLRELWSLMDFVFPGKLGTLPVFMSEFAVPINQGGYSNASEVMVATAYKCASVLRDTVSPYLLRRMKSDVSEHIKLPSKNEQVLFCRLTDEQRELYKEYLKCGEVGRILEGRCQIFVGLINLRKICNHPHLFSGGPKLFSHEKHEDLRKEDRFGFWEKAGKMVVIEALLKIWHKQEHRVLIFTQSRQMLIIIEKFVSESGYRYLKMDGSTSIAARQPLINKFNEDKSYFVMLLTTKVGGLGVNLTGANRVVIYDPDWNPATDTQARERAWRIGQQNAVTVYRLITAGTIEEKMYHRQIFKQFLCNKVLKDPRQRRFFKSNDLLELFTLKETDDGTTETSAIFAGTNSQVHVKPKAGHQKPMKDKRNSAHHSPKEKQDRNSPNVCKSESKSKTEVIDKVTFSQDKLDHMKKLAHELSLKFSSKVSADTKECKKEEELSCIPKNPFSETKAGDAQFEVGHLSEKCDSDKAEKFPNQSEDLQQEVFSLNSKNLSADEVGENSVGVIDFAQEFLTLDSDEDLEDLKNVASELSEELSQKVQAAAALNRSKPQVSKHLDTCCPKIQGCGLENDDVGKTDVENSGILEIKLRAQKNRENAKSSSTVMNQEVAHCSSPQKYVESTHRDRQNKYSVESSSRHTVKHKKSKHKKRKHKDAIFEGERVRGLVKSSTIEEKSKEEIDAEASHSAKQDDYVLRKLFSKTGIKTAMQHERIMESGHADYALVEGEARRVAQDAVRAMKASRQHCWSAMSGQPTWTGTRGSIRSPGERENRHGEDLRGPRPKFGKKKRPQEAKKTQDEGGSSALLSRIRARNILLQEEEDETAGSTSGALPTVPDVNKELLDDIRTFVSFGASVDGRATTEEIVSQFRDRLPAESTALFKQMLMKICEFHRLPSGQGVWKLIPEFQW